MSSSRIASRIARPAVIGAAAALALLAVALPASAHVTANPDTAEQGSYTKVSFRVPNEEDKADTTAVEVDLPLDHPIASVSVRPVPGWTVKVEESKLPKPITSDDGEVTKAVSKITWTKGAIAPGEFQEFDVSMGPLPTDTDALAFKAVQTYSDGQVVRWDQPTPASGEEPEHPAPTLHLTKPTDTATGSGAHGTPAASAAAATSPGAMAVARPWAANCSDRLSPRVTTMFKPTHT
jgi:uncharacterized protein YcnI